MDRAPRSILGTLVFALVAALPGCTPTDGCGDGPTCDDDERCVEGACVAPATTTEVKVSRFVAEPEQIAAGEAATLTWATRNAAACTLSPGIGAVPRSGSVAVRPVGTTSWTLSCDGRGGPAIATATVQVTGGTVDAGASVDGGDLDAGDLDAGGVDAGDGGSDGGDAGPSVPPVVVSGAVELLSAPPAALVGSAASAGAVLMKERQGVDVDEWLHADSIYPASYGDGQELAHTDPRAQIVPGQVLDSWLLHVENPSDTEPLEGVLVFAGEVVALAWRGNTLDDLDAAFALPDVEYPSGNARAYSLWSGDTFVLEGDRRTLRFSALGTDLDQLRVLVDTGATVRPLAQSWTVNVSRSGPLDLTLDQYQPEEHGVLVDEGEHSLATELSLDVSAPGQYRQGGALTPGTLPAGTAVHSWLLHYDPVPNDAGVTSYTAVITFERPVLGILLLTATLHASDDELARDDVTYPSAYSLRGIETNLGDEVWLSADQKSVRLSLSVAAGGLGLDQIRVVTEP